MYQNFITRFPQREVNLMIFLTVGILFVIFLIWQFYKWWTKKQKEARAGSEAKRELTFAQQLQKRMGADARVVYETWSWPKVSALDNAIAEAKFEYPRNVSGTEEFESRALGYYVIEKKIQDQLLRLWCIPYGTFTINTLFCLATCPMPKTPVRMQLSSDLFPGTQGHQLESRSFNSRYVLWSDEPKVLTAVFDPHLMAILEHFKYLHIRSLYVGRDWFQGFVVFPFTIDYVEHFFNASIRVVKNYISATAGMPAKPKGE